MCGGQGDHQKKYQYLSEAADIYRQVGDVALGSVVMQDLTWNIWDHGDLALAYRQMEEHIETNRRLRSRWNMLYGLGAAAHMALYIGDYDAAERYTEERVGIGLLLNKAEYQNGIMDHGSVDFWLGRLEAARQRFETVLSVPNEVANIWQVASCRNFLGMIAVIEGRVQEGALLLEEALALLQPKVNPFDVVLVDILLFLGRAACLQKDYPRSNALLRDSLERIYQPRRLPHVPIRLEWLAETATAMQEYRRGAVLLGAAHQLRETMGAPILPVSRPAYEATLQALQAALGRKAFQQAWEEGRAMSLEEGVAFALAG